MIQYINANDVLPKTLILQIQKYVGGNIIYIPQKDNDKKSWGASTNSRSKIAERNNCKCQYQNVEKFQYENA